jgi:DNA-binding NarL/FixJ family response regulator
MARFTKPYAEDFIAQRAAPKLAVLSTDCELLSSERDLREFFCNFTGLQGSGSSELPECVRTAIQNAVLGWIESTAEPQTTITCPVPDLLTRISMLQGRDGACLAVTFERLKTREDLHETAIRFGLTEREAEVAELLVVGLNGAQIAEKLRITQNTVHEHLKHIHTKVGVNKRGALVGRLLNR